MNLFFLLMTGLFGVAGAAASSNSRSDEDAEDLAPPNQEPVDALAMVVEPEPEPVPLVAEPEIASAAAPVVTPPAAASLAAPSLVAAPPAPAPLVAPAAPAPVVAPPPAPVAAPAAPVVAPPPAPVTAPASVVTPPSAPVAPAPVVAPPPAPVAAPAPVAVQSGSNVTVDSPSIDVAGLETIDVAGGRVTTLKIGEPEDILSVQVLEKPEIGNLTANPDGTLSLVLSHQSAKDFSGQLDFSYEVNYKDGSSETLTQIANVSSTRQLDGWGEGDFYMLETDDSGELVIEHGDNHREIYVTGNDLALSIEEIAELEQISVGRVTGQWLADSIYGKSPDTALDARAGRLTWDALTGENTEPGSHWLLFEKGYEYETGRLVGGRSEGESELHPLYIGSYGEGELPVLNGDLRVFQGASKNIVIRDVALGDNFQVIEGGNFILDGIDNNGNEISFQGGGAVTLRDSTITDTHADAPSQGGNTWNAAADRIQGLYVDRAQGVLLENNFFDLNGFELDYSYDASADAGQAPNQFNHNIYIQRDAGDVTLRDNFILRGASFGAQVRPGGFIEDNVFAGNNIGVNFLGGRSTGEGSLTGNFTLFTDNVVTSGGFHTVETLEGATTWGVDAVGQQSTLTGNIITHLVEPGTTLDVDPRYDATQRTAAIVNPLEERIYYNDTVVYNWALPNGRQNAPDANTEGLDTAVLDQTTIENFTAQLLGKSDGSVEELAAYLRNQVEIGAIDPVDADDVISYFQNGFGLASGTGERLESETLRFIPNALGDGIRWDNRLNWSTDDLPGTADGDSVDLGGNWVSYGGTTTVNDLNFGSGGLLSVTHGYLQVDGDLNVGAEGGRLDIDKAGQVWIDGYSDDDLLDVDLNGGRFANTGVLDGRIDLAIDDNGQALLATAGAELNLNAGSNITITGSDADVGFDGATGGNAALNVAAGARISFVADSNGFSDISEFRSGHYDRDVPDVASEINLNGGTLSIDLTALNGAALQEKLFAADEVWGRFDTVEFFGLANDQNATLTFDYDTDEVSIDISARGEGSGLSDTKFVGSGSNDQSTQADISALFVDVDWDALLAEADAAERSEAEMQLELV